MTPTGEALLEELRRQRRSGDPRLTPEGREILTRIVMGDLADEFADALAADLDADPLLGGGASVRRLITPDARDRRRRVPRHPLVARPAP